MIHHISSLPLDWTHGVTIFFFGDRQQGSPGYIKEAWQEFKNEFKQNHNAWALGLGDYGDFLRPSMRIPIYQVLQKDDSARQMMDDEIRKGHDAIIDEMEFLRGRLIGLHEGHHNWKFASGENTDQRLATALKARYLGWTASTRLALELQSKQKNHYIVTLLSTHGNANGRKVHSSLAWMENNLVASWVADIYAMGHGCKNAADVPGIRNMIRRIGPPGVNIQIPRLLAIGGFAKGYTDGFQSDYIERAGFAPQPIGWGIVRIRVINSNISRLAKGIPGRGAKTIQIEHLNRVLAI